MKRQILLGLAAWAVLGAASAWADVKVSNLFGDHMVLQRDIPVPVWGQADASEKVTVTFGSSSAEATADAKGHWMVKLPAQKTSADPQTLTIRGKNTLTIKDVLVGDVWVCSGQSNMEMTLDSCNAPQDIAAANVPTLRAIKVDHRALGQPTQEVPGHWQVSTPHTAGRFTAVGFYFARRIQKEVNFPIGLIDDNWGGTRIEPWIPPEGFALVESLAKTPDEVKQRELDYRATLAKSLDGVEKWIADARKAIQEKTDLPPQPSIPNNPLTDAGCPMSLYNGMIHPIVPYAIKGALWYQGEANGGEGDEYFHKMQALIGGWRKIWNQGDFPFYYVQLANWLQPTANPGDANGWARVREAQTKSLQIPHTGMAVIVDIGDANDIHPKDKFDVGERLALWSLKHDYGKTDLVVSGPLYKSMTVDGNKIRIAFDSVGGGLIVGKKDGRKPLEALPNGKLQRFAIAGEDKKWVWADAAIEGNCVVVSSPAVAKPVAVRYAFSMNPEGCNLYNKEGLPASPFRTDNW